MSKQAIAAGHTTGALVAVLCSIIVNKSVFWAFVHYFFSWFYVVWALVVHLTEIRSFFQSL